MVSINSDQGDWFFGELISLNSNQNELLRIISEAAPSFYNHIEVDDIRLTATIYQTLGRLHREWKSYIIPESVTLVQIEESTQLVDAIISLAHNQPLHQIGQHLSACLKTGEPDEAGQVQTALQITQHLQDQFNQLISSDLPGIILIRLITDQFNQITEALEHLVAYFAQHPAQHEWEATILDAKNLIRNKTLDSSILRKLLFRLSYR